MLLVKLMGLVCLLFSMKSWSQTAQDYDVLSKSKKIYIRTDFALEFSLLEVSAENYAAITINVKQDTDAARPLFDSLKRKYPGYNILYAPLVPKLADVDGHYIELQFIDGSIFKMPFRTAETSWEDSQTFQVSSSLLKQIKSSIANHRPYVSVSNAPFSRTRLQEASIQLATSPCYFPEDKKNKGIFSVFEKFQKILDQNSDNGSPVTESEQKYLFVKFFQSCVNYEEKIPVRSFTDLIDDTKNSFQLEKRSFGISEDRLNTRDESFTPNFKIKFN